MKKIIFQLLLILLTVAMLTACVDKQPDATQPSTEPVQPMPVTYKIALVNKAGTGLSEVGIRVYTDSGLDDLIAVGETDDEGVFTFEQIKGDSYVAVLSDLPTGYTGKEQYLLTQETTITPDIGVMSDEDMDTVRYRLGDAMLDFTLTGPEGETYTLSEMLQEKDAVILNFWYLNCDPCKGEFPHFQEVYEKYSDEVAFLALNPYDGDDAAVAAFKAENGYTFPMMKADERWESMFNIHAYPLTVVIDRYGNICLMHGGAIPDVTKIENMFGYFTAEDYEQEFFRSVNLIPDLDA